MFSRLWQWLAAAGAAIVAGLYALLHIRTRQRDSARESAEKERRGREASEAARETESRVRASQSAAREEAAQARRERNEDRAAGRRRGLSNDRLRDD